MSYCRRKWRPPGAALARGHANPNGKRPRSNCMETFLSGMMRSGRLSAQEVKECSQACLQLVAQCNGDTQNLPRRLKSWAKPVLYTNAARNIVNNMTANSHHPMVYEADIDTWNHQTGRKSTSACYFFLPSESLDTIIEG